MTKTATEVMQEAMLAAVVDAIVALKEASKGVPNTLLRDLNAIHANTAFADLPPAVQAAVSTSVRAGFHRLLREGYNVAPGTAPPSPSRAGQDHRRSPRAGERGQGHPGQPSRSPAGGSRPGGRPGSGPRPGGKVGGGPRSGGKSGPQSR